MKHAFTLVELLVTTVIFLILSTLLLPSVQMYVARAQVSKAGLDLMTVRGALTAYFTDYSSYPPKSVIPLISFLEIDEYYMLTTPISYISAIPQSPWKGKKYPSKDPPIRLLSQSNYTIYTGGVWGYGGSTNGPGWVMLSGGPMHPGSGGSPESWYSITNGVLSKGGFYMDSSGRTSIR